MELSQLTNEQLIEYYNEYKNMISKSGRAEKVKLDSFDLKFAYHLVRLLSECEQILSTGELDLQEKGRREHMKAIRRGEVSEEDIRKWAADKEHALEKLYSETKLPEKPDAEKIRALLLQCLEEHYGSLNDYLVQSNWAEQSLQEIDDTLNKIRQRLYK